MKEICENLSFDDYSAWEGLSNSKLRALKRSPMHMKYFMEQPDDSTKAQVFGRAVHCLVLEPERFNDRFIHIPKEIDRRTKQGKADYEAIISEYPNHDVLTEEERTIAFKMAHAVAYSKTASAFLRTPLVEVSLRWSDPQYKDINCKARFDAWNQELNAIVDIKTTVVASKSAFQKTLGQLGYYNQAAWYLDGSKAVEKQALHFVFVVIEKEPPFGVSVFRLTDEAVEYGRSENRELLDEYAHCKQTGKWSGYPDQVQDIGLPAWAVKQGPSLNGVLETVEEF